MTAGEWWPVLSFFAGALLGYVASIGKTERLITRYHEDLRKTARNMGIDLPPWK